MAASKQPGKKKSGPVRPRQTRKPTGAPAIEAPQSAYVADSGPQPLVVVRPPPPLVADGDAETVVERSSRVFTESSQTDVVLVQGTMPQFIGVTEDTLELNLKKYTEAYEAKRQWLIPLVAFLAIAVPLPTVSKFNGYGSVTSGDVETLFYASAFALLVWLVIAIFKAIFTHAITPADIIKACRSKPKT